MPNKKTIQEIISEAALEGAKATVGLQRKQRVPNLYRVTERLLRNYKTYKRLVEDVEEYGFEPTGKSHDITIAPPPGSGMIDKLDLYTEHVEARKASWARTKARYDEIDTAIRPFVDKREFVVIRMYYFNEDYDGNDRGDAKPYTFEDIADELSIRGIERSVRALRKWRTKLVQDMTVLLFGIDGAVSIESRNQQDAEKEEQHNDVEQDG